MAVLTIPCPRCGRELSRAARYCPGCGVKVAEATTALGKASAPAPAAPPILKPSKPVAVPPLLPSKPRAVPPDPPRAPRKKQLRPPKRGPILH